MRIRPCAADGKGSLRHESCRQPFSFYFNLIEPAFGERSNVDKPLHRLCSLMRKMNVRSVVFEKLAPFEEWEDELDALQIRFARHSKAQDERPASKAFRITFLRSPKRVPLAEVRSKDVLGYAVIVSVTRPDIGDWAYVLRGAVRVPDRNWWAQDGSHHRGPTNHYIHCYRRQTTLIGRRDGLREFSFPGVFFCQQNDLTHICAHAALRSAANSAWFVEGELTNGHINDILKIDHRKKVVGHLAGDPASHDGKIAIDGIIKVGERLQFGVQWVDFRKKRGINYADWSYPNVESGFPVIMSVDTGGEGHVVTMLGHTFNSDRWTPVARPAYKRLVLGRNRELDTYISAVRYTDHFVITDDNLGVNLTLPTEALQAPPPRRKGKAKNAGRKVGVEKPDASRILYVTGLVLTPQFVRSTGYFAELIAIRFAKVLLQSLPSGTCRWRDALLAAGNEIIGRTIFQNREAYVHQLRHSRDSERHRPPKDAIDRIAQSLPKEFWVTEVSLPDLLSANRRKLGDVLCVNDENKLNKAPAKDAASTDGVLLAWLPGLLVERQEGRNEWQLDRNWTLQSHVPVIRGSPLGVHEW